MSMIGAENPDHLGWPEPAMLATEERSFLDEAREVRWVKWPIVGALAAIPVGIILLCPANHILGAFLAFINCLITGWAIIKLARKRSLGSLIPIVFLTWLMIGWGLAPLVFAMFLPGAEYRTRFGHVAFLSGDVKLQTVIFLFLVTYLPVMFWWLRRDPPFPGATWTNSRRLIVLSLALFGVVTFVFGVVHTMELPGEGITGSLFNYTIGLLLIVGALIRSVKPREKTWLLVFLVFLLLLFALGNMRRNAIIPLFCFAMGIFFVSRLPSRTKFTLMVLLAAAVPTYVIVGNTTRMLIGTVGFKDIGHRWAAMKEWRYATQQQHWALTTLGRLFFDGGHSIIVFTPSEVPYVGFDGRQYLKETLVTLVPGKVFEHMDIYVAARYVGNFVLNKYGFNITRENQTGVSLLGHFWLLGGVPFIILGGLATAFVQGMMVYFINRGYRWGPEKALVLLAIILPGSVWMPGLVFIVATRGIFWKIVLGLLFFNVVVKPLLLHPGRQAMTISPEQEWDYAYGTGAAR